MDIKEHNGTSLAYMGDATMSLLVREMSLAQGWQKSKILQKKNESWVNVEVQAYLLIQPKERAFFSKEEYVIVLCGRNIHSAGKARNVDVATHRMLAGLEALSGWLYLTHREDRLKALWEEIQKMRERQWRSMYMERMLQSSFYRTGNPPMRFRYRRVSMI